MAANGIDINYEAFVQSIDQLFVGQVKEAEGHFRRGDISMLPNTKCRSIKHQ